MKMKTVEFNANAVNAGVSFDGTVILTIPKRWSIKLLPKDSVENSIWAWERIAWPKELSEPIYIATYDYNAQRNPALQVELSYVVDREEKLYRKVLELERTQFSWTSAPVSD